MVAFRPAPYVKSEEGRKVQKMLWNETIDEMAKMIAIPAWMTKV